MREDWANRLGASWPVALRTRRPKPAFGIGLATLCLVAAIGARETRAAEPGATAPSPARLQSAPTTPSAAPPDVKPRLAPTTPPPLSATTPVRVASYTLSAKLDEV